MHGEYKVKTEISIRLPGIENFSHILKLGVVCLGYCVNVLIDIVIQMGHRVVVGYLGTYKVKFV
jgi:hypothetical protein